jgi:hypothetical protein
MLIALVGFIGSGKDTVGRHLVETHGYQDLAFASALKDALCAIFGWERDMIDGKTPQSRAWRDRVDLWWATRLGIPHFTPRWAMQNVGTDCLRKHLHDDLWIARVERDISALSNGLMPSEIVVTDGRFPNELDMIRHRGGGKVIRVRRGPEPDWFKHARIVNLRYRKGPEYLEEIADLGLAGVSSTVIAEMMLQAEAELRERGIHISEYAWIGYRFDEIIENDDTLDRLFAKTDLFLGQERDAA